MGQGKRYKESFLKEYKKIIIFTIVLISIGLFWILMQTLSKYILTRKDIGEIHPSNFYFESNVQENNLYMWNGKDEYVIDIDLKNYEDEFRFSSFNIPYEISISTEADIDVITKINDVQASEGIIKGSKNEKKSDNIQLTISPKEKEILDDFTIKLKISSKSPYVKEIEGNLNIKIIRNSDYEINLVSENDYEKLLIKTNSYSGNIKIKYDTTKIMPYDFNKITNEGEIILNVEEKQNYQEEFIKLTSDTNIELGRDIIVEN